MEWNEMERNNSSSWTEHARARIKIVSSYLAEVAVVQLAVRECSNFR